MNGPLCTLDNCPKEPTFWEKTQAMAGILVTKVKETTGSALTSAGDALTAATDAVVQKTKDIANGSFANATFAAGEHVINATINITGNVIGGTTSVAQGAQHAAESLEALARLTKSSVGFVTEYQVPQVIIGGYTFRTIINNVAIPLVALATQGVLLYKIARGDPAALLAAGGNEVGFQNHNHMHIGNV